MWFEKILTQNYIFNSLYYALSIQSAADTLAQRDEEAQGKADKRYRGSAGEARPSTSQRCENSGKTGYNVRTCQTDVETLAESSDKQFQSI